jgi:hypothetical protein
MAPPRESLAGYSALLRLLKAWMVQPSAVFATGPGRDGMALSPQSEAADSSDLLKRRMRALHLDPNDLVRAPARMAGIKTGLCARCEARGKCMRDLDDEFTDPGWGDWRNYCPNATTLSLLSTLRECEEEQNRIGQAAQQMA